MYGLPAGSGRYCGQSSGEPEHVPTSERPSAIRTFLIADIRGYTRFTDQHGDEAASRLASTFAQIVAEAMEAWDGRLVELRGDEALCTFDSPRAALRCALELQQTFAEEASTRDDLPLHVGMGLDVGEAVPVGDGYRGAALNLAARLCSGAAAGEIRATQNLAHVAGPIPGVVYEPQGSEQLKGVAAEVAIVRVRSAQEDASTPRPGTAPLAERSPEPFPTELETVVPLVGRAADLLWLRWYWRRARLGHGTVVEVVGPAGIGKTRLLSELARTAHGEGAVVRLHPEADSTVPTVVILDEADDPRSTDSLEAQVADKAMLAVLARRDGPEGSTRPRRTLGPLSQEDVAAIAALYAGDTAEAPPAHRILEDSGGVPAAVHRLASQWARTAAMHRMSESARRTSRERRGLREAEEELIGHYADLELTRERTRLYHEAGTAARDICPYKGLAAYEAADAEYYFGREQLIGELVARVVGSSFVGLVGASGSGKSSVLSAGLLPALANGVLPGSSEWIQAPMRPGTKPMRSLADALRRTLQADSADEDAERLLDRIVGRMSGSQRLLIVIDQFEEVFSADEAERERFIGLITEGRPSVKVVLAVRADQYEKCALYPRLARLLAADQVLVGPLRSEEVAAIVRHPAERVGLRVEPELVEALIADLGTEPGAVPLLSTALLELWEAREDGRMTLSAYRTTGGLQGAVARLAESAYARLDAEEQAAARSLFMRLVGEGSEPDSIVRRRLSVTELETIDDPHIGLAVEKLTAGRLLTRDEGTVEVAHEALIREWPRLREWIEADAAGRQLRLHLIEAARAWDAGGRRDEDLYRGARLATALEWSAERESELNAVERDFLQASRASADLAAERQRRTNRILRGLLAGAGVLLVVALGAGAVAFVQAGQNAANASASQVRELSLAALSLTSEDPQLALLLASEAVDMAESAGNAPPVQALQALWSAYVAGKSTTAVPGIGSRAVAYSPDGSTLAVDAPESPDLLITLRDPSTGEERQTVPRAGVEGTVESIAYSPDGRWLAVATTGPAGATQGLVVVFDAATMELLHRLSAGHDGYRTLTVSDEGLLSAAATIGSQREIVAMVWDLSTGLERAVIGTAPGVQNSDLRYLSPMSVSIQPTTGQLLLGGVSGFENTLGFLVTLNLPDGVLRCPSCPETRPASMKTVDMNADLVVPSPDGMKVALADVGRGRVSIVDTLSSRPIFEPVAYRNARSLSWNADGTQLLLSGGEDAVVLDAVTGAAVVTLPSRGESILAASFRPGTDEIAAVSSGGGLRIQRTASTDGDVSLAGRQPVEFGVTADHVVVSLAGIGAVVFDRATGAEVHTRDFEVDEQTHAHVASDAAVVAGAYENASTGLIEAASLRDAARLPGCVVPAGLSSDGRYAVLSPSRGLADVCAGDTKAGVYDIAGEAFAVEYGLELLAHGAISVPSTEGGPRYAAVAAYADPSTSGRVELWDVEAGSLIASIDDAFRPGFRPAYVSFSPDGRYLGVGEDAPHAVVLDVAALAEGADPADATVFDREVHTARSPKAIVTGDGHLATSSGDGTYRFWDIESGEMTMQIEATGLIGTGRFEFSPDFASFYYEDGGGIIRQMPMDTDEMVELAESLITRSLTDAECREYLHQETCSEG